MIDFLHQDTDTVISFRLEGKIVAEDIDKIADLLEAKFDSGESVSLYIEIDNDLEESFGGIFEQAKKAFTVILPNLGKIKKAALVSDKNWLRKITDFKNMFSSMEMRGFPSGEKDAAFDWVKS